MSISDIITRIDQSESRAGRVKGSTQLIAVSKMQPLDRVRTVLDEGHRVFGENRVQEAASKWPELKQQYSNIKLHLIGPLQTNKIKQALGLFDAIHSVDRPKLARKLASEIQAVGRSPQLFIQVNTGAEPQKAGILPGDADAFIADCRAMDLTIDGLMVIPPVHQDPSVHFALLAELAARNGLAALSMGMSSDFEQAVAQGATHVRVGSAIFGTRNA